MKYTQEELKKYLKLSAKEMIAGGICPTCVDRQSGGGVYGDVTDKVIYRDDDIEVFLVGNPRAKGHAAISTIEHYQDLSEVSDELSQKIMIAACRLMNIIKEVYGAKRVYLCSMCDGEMNHCHVQLIPRYPDEVIGSTNFVKPRSAYVYEEEKLRRLRDRYKEAFC